MVKFPMTDVFPFTLLYRPYCFHRACSLLGCVNRAIVYISGIFCTKGTDTAREGGWSDVVPRIQSPIPLFFFFVLPEHPISVAT
jgi:hypothetical protein